MVSWEREYIVQTFVNSANELRLTSHRIVLVNLIKDFLYKCEDIDFAVSELKKVTEFSKFAIRLGQINLFTKNKPDFLALSSIIKRESQSLIPVVQQMLDSLAIEFAEEKMNEIKSKKKQKSENFEASEEFDAETDKEELKKEILAFIRKADSLLSNLEDKEIPVEDEEEILEDLNFLRNRLLILDNDLVENMFSVFDALFTELGDFENRDEIIEALRASMIVIAATIREKEVDLTPFIDRAMAYFETKKEI